MQSAGIGRDYLKYTIDRFEGIFAKVELENHTMIDIPCSALPADAVEGDIIEVKICRDETQQRREKIKNLMDDLFED